MGTFSRGPAGGANLKLAEAIALVDICERDPVSGGCVRALQLGRRTPRKSVFPAGIL